MIRKERKHLEALTGLRFFAAAYVLVYHALATGIAADVPAWTGPALLKQFIAQGHSAVSLFFVLSGFILVYTYASQTVRIGSFWVNRLARIYPVYAIGVLSAFPFFLAGVLGSGENTSHAFTSLVRTLALVNIWFEDPTTAINPPGWSLGAEAFFYLLFPLLLPMLQRASNRGLFYLLGGMAVAAALPLLTLLGLGVPKGHVAYAYAGVLPVFRVAEFVGGMAVGLLFVRGYRPRLNWQRVTVAVSLVCAGVFSVFGASPVVHYQSGLFFPLFALLIFALAQSEGGVLARSLSHPVAVRLGQASYSLYILHWPLFMWLGQVNSRVLGLQPDSFGFVALYVSVCLAASLVAFKYVEEPGRELIRRWHKARQARQITALEA